MEVKYKFPLFRIGLFISSHTPGPWQGHRLARQTLAPNARSQAKHEHARISKHKLPIPDLQSWRPPLFQPKDVRYFTTMSNGSNYASDMIFKQARHSEI